MCVGWQSINTIMSAGKASTPNKNDWLLRMFAAIMQCLLGSNQEELCLTNNALVENEQQLQSQDHSSKFIPLHPGMTFQRRLLMN
jgi:hypothetical protein